jgi:serine protease
VITIGASTEDDERWPFSNWGSCVNTFAPGDRIRTPEHSGSPYNTYARRSGTSHATPFVTGIVAVFLEGHPSATPAQVWTHVADSATVGELEAGTLNGSPNLLAFVA